MNRHVPPTLAWLVVMTILTFGIRSQIPETIPSIQWGWQDGPILRRFAHGRTLEFGLRSDGVVVWRETVAQTNSPAENLGVLHRSGMRPQIVPALTNPPPLPR